MNIIKSFLNVFSVNTLLPDIDRKKDVHYPTTKEVYSTTLHMAWPSAVESLLIALVSIVDMIMVSSIGTQAVAAVGISSQPRFLIMSVVLALNMGTTVVVARRKGANDQVNANLALKNALIFSIGLSLLTTVIGFIFAPYILEFAGAGTDYIAYATSYYRIILIGAFFLLISLTISSAQRGVGNTRVSMVINISANLVNVVFNYFLINGIWIFPRWGIVGAATATSIGNFVGFLLAVYSVMHRGRFLSFIDYKEWKLDIPVLKVLWQVSYPALIEQIFLRFGFLMYQKAVAGLGTIQFATHFIVMQMMSLSFSIGDGLSIATSSLVGQSLGAKRKDLAVLYGKVSQRVGLVAAMLLALIIIVFRVQFVDLFTDDVDIIAMGSNIMIILAVIVNFQISQVIIMGSLRGAGDVKFVAKLSMFSVSFLRPALTYVLAYLFGLGIYGAWFSVVLDQSVRYFISRLRFKNAKWLSIEI